MFKKNKLLIFIFTLFSIFLISDRVEALSYNVNDVDYQVNNIESFRDWCYFSNIKGKITDGFVIGHKDNMYYCVFGYRLGNWLSIYKRTNSIYLYNTDSHRYISLFYISYNISNDVLTSPTSVQNPSVYNVDYSNKDIFDYDNHDTLIFNSNFSNTSIESKYENVIYYDIKYYLNNELYDTITVEGGSSHTLKNNPEYNSTNQYWSGWTYDSNIDLSNITSDVNIYGTISDKPIYKINYYINNELYHTDNVIEGDSYDEFYTFTDYNSYTHTFSGFTYDNNIDFSNVRQNIDIYGTLTEKEKLPVYVDFPITKKEFYSLEFMLGILITMLILKWFFPFKMGGDYK